MSWTPGAWGRQADDDTMELLRLLGQPNQTVTLDAGRTYRTRTVAFAAGVTLIIPASTVLTVLDDGLAASAYLYVAVPGVVIEGTGTIKGSSNLRTAVYGLVRAVGATGLIVDGPTFDGGPSNAIWTSGGSGMRVRNCTVKNTGADGIQITRAETDFQVTNCNVHDCGDDGISVNSYTPAGPCTNGLISGNNVHDITAAASGAGRGIASDGGQSLTIQNNTITNVNQVGIILSGAGSFARGANATVQGNTIRNTGVNIPGGGRGDGIYATQTDVASITGNDIATCAQDGIHLVDSTSTGLAQSGNTIGTVTGSPVVHE